jgi:hypothetical protein
MAAKAAAIVKQRVIRPLALEEDGRLDEGVAKNPT